MKKDVERGIGVEDRLGAVAPGGDREMGREDGEGIDEHVEVKGALGSIGNRPQRVQWHKGA